MIPRRTILIMNQLIKQYLPAIKHPLSEGVLRVWEWSKIELFLIVIISSIASSSLRVSYFLRLGFYFLNLISSLIYAWVTKKELLEQWKVIAHHMIKSVAIPDSTFLDRSIKRGTGVLWGTCNYGGVTITYACVAEYKFHLRAL